MSLESCLKDLESLKQTPPLVRIIDALKEYSGFIEFTPKHFKWKDSTSTGQEEGLAVAEYVGCTLLVDLVLSDGKILSVGKVVQVIKFQQGNVTFDALGPYDLWDIKVKEPHFNKMDFEWKMGERKKGHVIYHQCVLKRDITVKGVKVIAGTKFSRIILGCEIVRFCEALCSTVANVKDVAYVD